MNPTSSRSQANRLAALWPRVEALTNGQRSVAICSLFGRFIGLAKHEPELLSNEVIDSLEAAIESAGDGTLDTPGYTVPAQQKTNRTVPRCS